MMAEDGDSEDLLLIKRVLSGEGAAFASLVRRHREPLRRFCLARLGDPDDAEDAVQDVFLRAYRSLSSFRIGQSFPSWLFGIAVNRVKTRYAVRGSLRALRERLLSEAAVDHPGGRGGDAEVEALCRLDEELIRAAVRGLSRAHRRVAELYYFAGLSVEEASQTLGIGLEAVKSRLFRARKALKKALDATAPGNEG